MKSFGRRSSVVGPSLFGGPSDPKELYEAGGSCGDWRREGVWQLAKEGKRADLKMSEI